MWPQGQVGEQAEGKLKKEHARKKHLGTSVCLNQTDAK